MVFASGKRPSADDIERLLASADIAGAAARISFRPPDDGEGLLELLVSGLTFDLSALWPAKSAPVSPLGHAYGLVQDNLPDEMEAITLFPAQHISTGFAIIPVVQAMVGLAAQIALPLSVEAVCWHPARSWMEPQYFSRIGLNWLSGGAFPALGLTALSETPRGISSEGLGFFANQELHVDRRVGEATAQTAKLAVRFIDYIVANGPFKDEIAFEGTDGEALRVELSESGRVVTVKRQA